MRILRFQIETTDRLRAFAGDPDVNKLSHQHGPWTATGTISRTMLLPTTCRATRSRKQSMRKAFNFGDCATRSDTDQRSVSSEVPCQRSRLMQIASPLRRNSARAREWATPSRSAP